MDRCDTTQADLMNNTKGKINAKDSKDNYRSLKNPIRAEDRDRDRNIKKQA